ncbi:hypothetical protein EDC01DRAFT_645010 [Geopyxis carbonaria]|nr:hypothetical protein EDC01DRAFT_645010 [Geopyxis carbonaria]
MNTSITETDDTRTQTRKSNLIKEFLIENQLQVFTELCSLREMGWNSNVAERYFTKQRTTADSSSSNKKTQWGFYKRMIDIAEEINLATGIFAFPRNQRIRILDTCMAPGAFSDYAIRQSPLCKVDGLTLPAESGGHEVLVRPSKGKISITYTDVTLHSLFLPAGHSIPADFPDRLDFDNNPPLPQLSFYDIIICDGQRLRTHEHGERRGWEPGRLLLSQLILGLNHIKPGGSMLVLLHRVEQWNTVSLMYRFSEFSDISLFKPNKGHANRSSFYLIAQNIRPSHAAPWIEHLKLCWYKMTFEGEEGRGIGLDCAEDMEVEDVIKAFGSTLMQKGHEIWKRQRDALRSAKWIGGSSSGSSHGEKA